jgi:mannosyltransferase OCH1-like enzyme
MKEHLGHPDQEVIDAYLCAASALPSRAEALHGASRFCRSKGRHEEGYQIAKRGLDIPMPIGALFVEAWIYDYGLPDEFAVHAYWTERYQDCLDGCERLLREGKIPQDMYGRVSDNAKFAAGKMKLQNIFSDRLTSIGEKLEKSSVVNTQERSGRAVQIYTKQSRIFRTIHIVWVGDEAKRPDNCIETWRKMNPDWTVRIWGNYELQSRNWQNITHIRAMLTRELCGVADMMRWEILHEHGGFAIDADSICLRPLAEWLFEPDVFACWENEIARPGLIANGYVYSHPKNGLIEQIIRDIKGLPDLAGKLAWQLTGPQRLSDTIRNMAYTGITVYPSHYFMPEHLTGIKYKGNGPVFAAQLWGRARHQIYDTLRGENVNIYAIANMEANSSVERNSKGRKL